MNEAILKLDDLSSLDDLFDEAQVAATLRLRVKPRGKPGTLGLLNSANPSTLYTNPANWLAKRKLGLIHRETQTYLGTFQEWTHRLILDARKLTRIEELTDVNGTEEVSGPAYQHFEVIDQPTTDRVLLVLSPELAFPRVIAIDAQVVVFCCSGGYNRIELAKRTAFTDDSESNEIFELPAGTNILPQLTHSTKEYIKELLCQGN